MGTSDETPQDLFVRVLEIEPEWAAVLVTSGFTSLEEIAYVPIDELKSIEGLAEQQIQAWRARARNHLLVQAIGGGDEGDPLVAPVVTPPKPMSGGSGAKTNDNDGR